MVMLVKGTEMMGRYDVKEKYVEEQTLVDFAKNKLYGMTNNVCHGIFCFRRFYRTSFCT